MVEVQSPKSEVERCHLALLRRDRQIPPPSRWIWRSSGSGAAGWDGGLGAWASDQRGSTLTQFVLVLPLLLVLLYGSFAVWKVASAKQSLASGAYQAARYLSVEGRYLDYPGEWEYAARIIIVRELENNSLLRPLPQPTIVFEPSFRPQCPTKDAVKDPWPHLNRALFTIRAEITLPWPARIPFLDPETITLVEKRTSYIECGPIFEPTPTPTEEPVPTPTSTPGAPTP